ncbi:23S rRNA (guanosine-2'-O-)-methyltransferase RlmB [Rubripirellula amarantea]|uniref:23S rRNA (Guanosine-2'-O-)-methyltransferase RlmB n=1 Tax=Rubripirellula amarantea TaxID=2527999 RepID=A0A5C5WR76_9BACT|nr:RNA methyltransferase [Rubripirellula amarantea]TWT52745.1 23S rRNA (guanosine-2'-O-)-methyltransferase RlmB [Rubripirellula amarantea]
MSESERVVLRSPSNPQVKHLVRMRNNRARRKAGCVIVDGWRETCQAISAKMVLKGLYFCPGELKQDDVAGQDDVVGQDEWHDHHWRDRVLSDSAASKKSVWVSSAILDKIGYGESSRGVVAEFERPATSFDTFGSKLAALGSPDPVILVLDRIEKPGNIGAIFRTADAAGVDAVLICDGGDSFHPNAIRSSSGGVFHVPWAEGTFEEVAGYLQSINARIMAARVESSESCWTKDYSGCIAIVVGNEADGLQDRWSKVGGKLTEGIHIPMAGQVDSLNVSVAAAVLAFTAKQARLTAK